MFRTRHVSSRPVAGLSTGCAVVNSDGRESRVSCSLAIDGLPRASHSLMKRSDSATQGSSQRKSTVFRRACRGVHMRVKQGPNARTAPVACEVHVDRIEEARATQRRDAVRVTCRGHAERSAATAPDGHPQRRNARLSVRTDSPCWPRPAPRMMQFMAFCRDLARYSSPPRW